MHKARTAIAKALVIATALAAFAPSMVKAANVNSATNNVALSATVENSVTLTINNTTLTYGVLTSANGRWATGSGTASPTSGNTLTMSTNAASGISVALTGTTLTDGAKTITAIGATGSASTPGSEQFGVAFGNATGLTIDTDYTFNATPASAKYAFNSGDAVLTSAAPVSATADAYYLANIAGLTKAGSYSTTLTYTATGTF